MVTKSDLRIALDLVLRFVIFALAMAALFSIAPEEIVSR